MTNYFIMAKEPNNPRLFERRQFIKNEINQLDKQGYRLNAAVVMMSKRLFISEATVYADYYKFDEIKEIIAPANPPQSRC